jgi:hypothetical protein
MVVKEREQAFNITSSAFPISCLKTNPCGSGAGLLRLFCKPMASRIPEENGKGMGVLGL